MFGVCMSNAWGGFSNGAIPLSKMVAVQGRHYFEATMAAKMNELIRLCAAKGVHVSITEGYRAIGVPNDQYVVDAAKTSTKGSNQWFQIGRKNRGLTPAAGIPGTSIHGWGQAADISPGRNNAVVLSVAKSLGLSFTVASESWHVAMTGAGTSAASTHIISDKDAQKLLNKFGYNLVEDGDFGPKSKAALKDFQSKHGLVPDMKIGPKTLAELNKPSPAQVAAAAAAVKAAATAKAAADAKAAAAAKAAEAAAVKATEAAKAIADAKAAAAVKAAEAAAVAEAAAKAADAAKEAVILPIVVIDLPELLPQKEDVVTSVKDEADIAAQAAAVASLATLPASNLGVIIPTAAGRKIAYAVYAGASLIVTNTAIAFASLQAPFPGWLIVSIAVVGNLAAPFGAIAIANAGTKK